MTLSLLNAEVDRRRGLSADDEVDVCADSLVSLILREREKQRDGELTVLATQAVGDDADTRIGVRGEVDARELRGEREDGRDEAGLLRRRARTR